MKDDSQFNKWEDRMHKKQDEGMKMDNESSNKESHNQKADAFLGHPRVHAVKQHKLINDLAYHLHHPQMKEASKGPSFPPQNKPKC
jgi:hypothetical protein